MIKTRFAPSPTGFLHVGGLRTALYSYLFAKQHKGVFLLRIEDTDRQRMVEGGVENILQSLKWAGIEPDEGVKLDENGHVIEDGENGPYQQSKRSSIHKEYAEKLVEQGDAYYCFCGPERLGELREYQEKNKIPPGYDGHCRDLDLAEAKERIKNGEKYVIRMKMPKEGETVFEDLVRGEVRIKNSLVDDQVLLKSDGYPTYHLAVVDDHLMGVTHVIRGEEWISSVPKYMRLYEALGWEAPKFAHLPLLLNSDKTKLSKRQGDVAVEDYKNKGYLPEALLNFVAFLGWNPGDERELFTLEDLLKNFSLERVGKAGAVFNMDKLNWYNQQYIRALSDDNFIKAAEEFVKDLPIEKYDLKSLLSLQKERITTLKDLPEVLDFVFNLPDYEKELLIWKKSTPDEVKNNLKKIEDYLNTFSIQDWTKEKLEEKMIEWIKNNNFTNGEVLYPLRVALSGLKNSPGPFEIAGVLGKDESLLRIKKAIEKF